MNLNPGEIHIWFAAIDERFDTFLDHSFLSVNEKRNAGKYAYDMDAFLYSVRHNLLRIILGRYLKCNPLDFKFNSNHYQKPHIFSPNTTIEYNISISSNRFVAAFCHRHSIGVDVEIIRNLKGINQMLSEYFTIHEADWIFNNPENKIETAFFNIWAQKEALVKAIGKGLDIELNRFNVLSNKPFIYGNNEWHITPLTLFDDCAAALAVNNPDSKISYYNAADLL